MTTKSELKNGATPVKANDVTDEAGIIAVLDNYAIEFANGREAWAKTFFDFARWSEKGLVKLNEKTKGGKAENIVDDVSRFVDRMAKTIKANAIHEKALSDDTKKTKKTEFRAAVKLGAMRIDGKPIATDILSRAKMALAETPDASSKQALQAYYAVAVKQNKSKVALTDDEITKACAKKSNGGSDPTVLAAWQEILGKADALLAVTDSAGKAHKRSDGVKDETAEGIALRSAIERHVKRLVLAANKKKREEEAAKDAAIEATLAPKPRRGAK